MTLGAVAALVLAVVRKRYELMLLLLCAVTGALLIDLIASPWLGGKGLATGSIAIPFGALVTAGWLLQRDRSTVERIGGAVLGVIVVGGVAWSNLLAYHAVSLAPRQIMAEVATIGGRIAGQGPTLMDEFSSYATHHFLRDAAPESASDIRTRPDYLIRELAAVRRLGRHRRLRAGLGARVPHAGAAARAVGQPPTLAVQARLPGPRLAGLAAARARQPARAVPRGVRHDIPAGPGACLLRGAQVREAEGHPRAGRGAGAQRDIRDCLDGHAPAKWSSGSGRFLTLDGAGTAKIPVAVTAPGRYTVWLDGSARAPVTLSIDGRKVGEVRDQLQEPGQYMQFGNVALQPGRHTVQLQYGGGDWRPGSGGPPEKVGPLALTLDAPAPALLRVPPSQARSLCGRTLDWIEGLGASRT